MSILRFKNIVKPTFEKIEGTYLAISKLIDQPYGIGQSLCFIYLI